MGSGPTQNKSARIILVHFGRPRAKIQSWTEKVGADTYVHRFRSTSREQSDEAAKGLAPLAWSARVDREKVCCESGRSTVISPCSPLASHHQNRGFALHAKQSALSSDKRTAAKIGASHPGCRPHPIDKLETAGLAFPLSGAATRDQHVVCRSGQTRSDGQGLALRNRTFADPPLAWPDRCVGPTLPSPPATTNRMAPTSARPTRASLKKGSNQAASTPPTPARSGQAMGKDEDEKAVSSSPSWPPQLRAQPAPGKKRKATSTLHPRVPKRQNGASGPEASMLGLATPAKHDGTANGHDAAAAAAAPWPPLRGGGRRGRSSATAATPVDHPCPELGAADTTNSPSPPRRATRGTARAAATVTMDGPSDSPGTCGEPATSVPGPSSHVDHQDSPVPSMLRNDPYRHLGSTIPTGVFTASGLYAPDFSSSTVGRLRAASPAAVGAHPTFGTFTGPPAYAPPSHSRFGDMALARASSFPRDDRYWDPSTGLYFSTKEACDAWIECERQGKERPQQQKREQEQNAQAHIMMIRSS